MTKLFDNYNSMLAFHAVSHLRMNVTHAWTSKKRRHSRMADQTRLPTHSLTQDDQNFKLKSQTLPSYPSRHLKYFSNISSLHPWNLLDQNIHPEVSVGIFSLSSRHWFSNSLLCKKKPSPKSTGRLHLLAAFYSRQFFNLYCTKLLLSGDENQGPCGTKFETRMHSTTWFNDYTGWNKNPFSENQVAL